MEKAVFPEECLLRTAPTAGAAGVLRSLNSFNKRVRSEKKLSDTGKPVEKTGFPEECLLRTALTVGAVGVLGSLESTGLGAKLFPGENLTRELTLSREI